MNVQRILLVIATTISMVVGGWSGALPQDRQDGSKPIKIRRAKRPVFTERDWDGIYFSDLLREGLVGQRPEAVRPAAGNPNAMSESDRAGSTGDTAETNHGWSNIVDPSVVEDEIKKLEQELRSKLTTPGRFKSDHQEFHRLFSVLSTMFAMVMEYDGEVRWKDQAPRVLASITRAAANSRVGTVQAFQYSKQQIEYLTEMVRGGNFAGTEPPVEAFEWSEVAWRTPLMQRLELALSHSLKPDLANNTQFKANIDRVLHEAEMVAALAHVLGQEGMDDADDEGYVAFAEAMGQAARELVMASRQQDYDGAARAANALEQSCNDCHEEWR